ncbi:uncharacterized protein LOC117083293 isoform X2 [Trachypithecus francoisi]|uniref:uncharacterized protein LOC117083293 isoform X2 n=1 Tax=Trachypithecus francoisi TaxID=54180 RepID=UPI00141B01B5|nr:uncharacterized protein LOC117083293 isoform X2 [Trachypithecus francoisi]XP_033066675.1 uncharacterized protein LOC117083293 isoform X2 [Trachypithecus francoisi]
MWGSPEASPSQNIPELSSFLSPRGAHDDVRLCKTPPGSFRTELPQSCRVGWGETGARVDLVGDRRRGVQQARWSRPVPDAICCGPKWGLSQIKQTPPPEPSGAKRRSRVVPPAKQGERVGQSEPSQGRGQVERMGPSGLAEGVGRSRKKPSGAEQRGGAGRVEPSGNEWSRAGPGGAEPVRSRRPFGQR